VPAWTLTAGGGALAVVGLGTIAAAWEGVGLCVSLVAVAVLATGAALAALVGETRRAELLEISITVLSVLAVLSLGASERLRQGDWTPAVLALVAAGCQILVERIRVRQRRWWSSPAAQLVLLTPFALASYAEAGLALLAAYAFATLAAAVEGSREKA
jgi:hypothetical protein